MLVAGFIIGLAWYLTGMVGFIYWSNKFVPNRRGDWDDHDVYHMILASLVGPFIWLIGYIAYRLEK